MSWFEIKKKKNIIKWYKSIKVNLSLMITLVGLVPIVFLLVAILSVFNDNARSQKLSEVKNYATIAKDILATSNLEDVANMETVAQIYNGRIVVIDKNLKVKYDANIAEVENGKYCISEKVINCLKDGKDSVTQKDKIYTEYNFASNKGYGAAVHIEALKRYGPTPIHRKTFIQNFVTVKN